MTFLELGKKTEILNSDKVIKFEKYNFVTLEKGSGQYQRAYGHLEDLIYMSIHSKGKKAEALAIYVGKNIAQ